MFDTKGFFVPTSNSNIFSYPPTDYYQLNQYCSANEYIEKLATKTSFPLDTLNNASAELIEQISSDDILSNLLESSIHPIPFLIRQKHIADIGSYLENVALQSLQDEFCSQHPGSHFKVVTQDKQTLSSRIYPSEFSNYSALINSIGHSNVFGFYFPLAFFQHSISSQRIAFQALPKTENICLSGPIEIISSLITDPSLLTHSSKYSPILCMSGVQHADNRLELCIKSYGPHLEMWALSNMLVPGVEQMSEQWSGGLTVFTSLN
jgi:hypothetical protein